MSSELVFVHTTVEKEEEAQRLARELLEENLAGCINVGSPVTSFYCWQGNQQETTEYPLLIKTTAENISKLEDWLKNNHPYDCPEIVVTSVEDVNDAYLNWLRGQVVSEI